MDYMSAASSLAAAHRGKLKNLRKSTLWDNKLTHDPRAYILQFEKEALAHDTAMAKITNSGACKCVFKHTDDPFCVIPTYQLNISRNTAGLAIRTSGST